MGKFIHKILYRTLSLEGYLRAVSRMFFLWQRLGIGREAPATEYNRDNHKVIVDGEEIKLTPIEFDILYLLASNPGKVFSTDEIFEKVWNEKVYEANNTVMVHIRRLRGKMKEDTRQNKIITTVWGVGYKIEK